MEDYTLKLDYLLKTFLKGLEHWVEEFEDLSLRRKKAAAISPRFLEKQAKILIKAFNELLEAFTEEYELLILERYQPNTEDERKILDQKMISFKSQAVGLIQRINVKAQLLIDDFIVTPFNPEVIKQLKELADFTYEKLINKLKLE